MTSDGRYRPSEEMLRALIEHGLDVLLLADAEARLLYVSPSVERVLGFTPEEMLGSSGFDFTHPDEAEENRRTLARVLDNPGARVVTAYRARHKAGHYCDMEITAQNLLADPSVGALVFNARDVTERNRVRRQLRAQEQRFRLLAENAHDIITIHQLAPKVALQYISPSAERLLGYPLHRFYDDPDFHKEIIHPDDAGKFAELVIRSAESVLEPTTLRWRCADGRVLWIEQVVVPLPGEDDTVVASIARDVTDKVELERNLRRAEKMEALGRLAGGITHDFSNLLGVAKLSVGRLLRQRADDVELVDDLELIDEAIDRGAGLVHQLLAFSRRDTAAKTVVNVGLIVEAMEPMLRRLLPENIELTVEIAGREPWIEVAPARLEQLVMNLVVNARDAMPTGGALLVRVGDDADRVTLAVVDDGVGMDAAQRDRVLEPFFTTKDVGQGTGLGLAVVYGVVDQSGGHLRIESAPGAGTAIRIDWPRATEAPADGVSAAHGVRRGRRETVLVVEDEPSLRSLIADALAALDYDVIAATDVDEALRLGRDPARTVDLLLTDVVMPRRSGRQLADQIRAVRPALRVLFMSGYTADALSVHHLDGPILEKPFTEDELARSVRAALDS